MNKKLCADLNLQAIFQAKIILSKSQIPCYAALSLDLVMDKISVWIALMGEDYDSPGTLFSNDCNYVLLYIKMVFVKIINLLRVYFNFVGVTLKWLV